MMTYARTVNMNVNINQQNVESVNTFPFSSQRNGRQAGRRQNAAKSAKILNSGPVRGFKYGWNGTRANMEQFRSLKRSRSGAVELTLGSYLN
jgi:hypothetical protein